MNEYLKDLLEAFTKVNKRYYFAEVFKNLDTVNDETETIFQSTENSFSAELFRHWRNIMEQNNKTLVYNDIALDFDVRKNWFEIPIITYTSKSYRPDIVLHKSQVEWDPQFQKVYVEVKTNPRPYVKDDIQKLANAISRLQFERGVLISVNSDLSKLKTLIGNIINSESRRLHQYQIQIEWDRIFLFHSIINNDSKYISEPISFSELI